VPRRRTGCDDGGLHGPELRGDGRGDRAIGARTMNDLPHDLPDDRSDDLLGGFDEASVPALDEVDAERLRSLDESLAAARAESLRAGLADYELDEQDLELLDGNDWVAELEGPEPALPVLAVVGRPNVGK